MIGAWRVEQIRAAEAELMASLPPGTLMQRAAAGLAAACAELLDGPYGARVLLLVGGGDNGGDTLFAGARLARRGARVDAVLLGGERTHQAGLAALRSAGGRVAAPDDDIRSLAERAHLAMDGIVGIGGTPGLRSPADKMVADVADSGVPVVAVDLPSGIAVDTGEAPRDHVRADLTVTFGAHKVGLLIDPGAEAAGPVRLVDIGLAPHLADAPEVEALEVADVRELLPHPGRRSHKYTRGVVGVAAGSPTYTGAAVLAVGAAARSGAGMVRYHGPDHVAEHIRQHWPEAVVGIGQVQAWVFGPGVPADDEGARRLQEVLDQGVPVVIDAGGLEHVRAPLRVPALLTPHEGELARLLGVDREQVQAARLEHARLAARQLGATILLKGATTLVADPAGHVRVNRTGVPALATAGSGDVLAGLAGALLAGGLTPLDAGSVAAYLHGVAGSIAARESGSPTASDLLDAVPRALREHLG